MTIDLALEETACAMGCDPAEELLFTASAEGGNYRFRIVRCARCGLIYLNPRPAPSALLTYYQSDYYGFGDDKFDKVTEGAVAFFVWWRGAVLKRYVPPG